MLRVVALKFCAAGAYVPWHLGTRCRMVDVVIVGGTWIGTGFVLLLFAWTGYHTVLSVTGWRPGLTSTSLAVVM